MASPPPFDICDDLDDDDIDEPATAVPADRHHPAAAPTPNGLNDRLLRLARTRQDPNPNPNPIPPPEAAAAEEGRKVKLEGRRRLCKLGDTATATATQQLLEDEEEDLDDCESIRDIMDDLTTRLDSLSVRKPNPTARQLAPLPCAITVDPDAEDGASSPLRISSSDDEPAAITRRAELNPQPTSVASAFTDYYACGKGKGKGTKDAGRINRVSKASSFVDSDSDYHDGDEGEGAATAYAAKDVTRKRRPPKASTFRNNDDSSGDGLGQQKENRGVVENDAEDADSVPYVM